MQEPFRGQEIFGPGSVLLVVIIGPIYKLPYSGRFVVNRTFCPYIRAFQSHLLSLLSESHQSFCQAKYEMQTQDNVHGPSVQSVSDISNNTFNQTTSTMAVQWDDNDLSNPRNMSLWRKWLLVITVSMGSLCVLVSVVCTIFGC